MAMLRAMGHEKGRFFFLEERKYAKRHRKKEVHSEIEDLKEIKYN